MNKKDWVKEATNYLEKLTGEWYPGEAEDYCESLYETYVLENAGCELTPSGAVLEDMTYWD